MGKVTKPILWLIHHLSLTEKCMRKVESSALVVIPQKDYSPGGWGVGQGPCGGAKLPQKRVMRRALGQREALVYPSPAVLL